MENFIVIEKPSMMVVGIACRTSNTPEAAPNDIPKLWGKFYSEDVLGRIPNKASNEVVALYCDYEGDYTKPYTCVIGCPVTSLDKVPEGMVAKVLPATSYVPFQAIGEHPKALMDVWTKVWQTNLDRTYTGDFEVYGPKFAAQPQEVEVFVAVRGNSA